MLTSDSAVYPCYTLDVASSLVNGFSSRQRPSKIGYDDLRGRRNMPPIQWELELWIDSRLIR